MDALRYLKSTVRRVLPEAVRRKQDLRRAYEQEPLLRYLKPWVAGGTAIDVGANIGVYTNGFSQWADKVIAFEPVPELARALAKRFPKAEVYACALSNTVGQMNLYVPELNGRPVLSRSSLNEDANSGFDLRSRFVEVKRLDDFMFRDVTIIKVDVEGHEQATIQGATETIKEWKPILVIEIEERHHPGQSWALIHWIESLGYSGRYFDNDGLHSLGSFDFNRMQNPANLKDPFGRGAGQYINNFVFVPC